MHGFAGKTLVIRLDEVTVFADHATIFDDLDVLRREEVFPVLIAPSAEAARGVVRAMNRSANVAVRIGGSDAGLIPGSSRGLGRIQPAILRTLLQAHYVPVVEPSCYAVFEADDIAVNADDIAAALAGALEAVRAIFFHAAGGLEDPQTHTVVEELTPAEALALADDERLDEPTRSVARAAALGVRSGAEAAQILDGRIAHATIIEFLTAQHVGTRVTGAIRFAA